MAMISPFTIRCIEMLIISATVVFVGALGIFAACLIWKLMGDAHRIVRRWIWKLKRR